jgi:branched-chain amino acid transport system permease protein
MGTHRSGYFKTSYAQDLQLLDTSWRRGFLAAAIASMLLAPLFLPDHLVYLLDGLFIAVIGALALNLLTGYAGQISLGHAAFMAVGALSSHWLVGFNLPFLVVVPLTAVIGGCLGVIVGAPALRLRGLYLVVATVGFHYIVAFLANAYQSGGDLLQSLTGLVLPAPDLGFTKIETVRQWYVLLFAFMLAVTCFCVNLVRTRPGRAWIALRDRDITAAALGIDVSRYKILAFVVSSALTTMSGSLLAYFIGSVSAEYFTLTLAISYLAMVVIGGAGSILGAYLGATFTTLLPHTITAVFSWVGASPRVQMLYVVPSQIAIFGIAMILFLMFEPRGLVGIWGRIRTYFELWPLRQTILSERK